MDSKGLNTGVSTIRSVSAENPIAAILAPTGIVPSPGNTKVSFDTPTFENSQVGGGHIKIDYELGSNAKLTTIAAARFYNVNVEFRSRLAAGAAP